MTQLEQVVEQLHTWARVTPHVQEALLDRRVPIPLWGEREKDNDGRRHFVGEIGRILIERNLAAGWDTPDIAVQVADQILGIGILEPLLHVDGMEEIIVRRGRVMIEYRGQKRDLGKLADDLYFYTHARRISEERRRAMRTTSSFALADLPDGSRFTALIPPLSVNGTAINVRVFSKQRWAVTDLARKGVFNRLQVGEHKKPPPTRTFHSQHTTHLLELARQSETEETMHPATHFLSAVARSTRHSVLLSGRPGVGKSTLLSALTHSFPPLTQVCIAETFQEVKPAVDDAAWAVVQEHRGRQDPQYVTLDQVINTLYTRMRPDVVIVGELVGNEATEFLEAMSLGIPAMSTIHGDSARDALHRLERRAQREGVPLQVVREAVSTGIQMVIQMSRDDTDRFVSEIVAVDGLDETNHYRLIPIATEKGSTQ